MATIIRDKLREAYNPGQISCEPDVTAAGSASAGTKGIFVIEFPCGDRSDPEAMLFEEGAGHIHEIKIIPPTATPPPSTQSSSSDYWRVISPRSNR